MKLKFYKLLLCCCLVSSLLLCSSCNNSAPSEKQVVVDIMNYENVNLLDYGAKADASEDIAQAVAKAAPLLGEHQALYFPNGTYAVNEDLVIDAPVKLSGNVSIVVAEGKTLTINGLFGAAIQNIFGGKGSVRITNDRVWGYMEWFEADEDDTTAKFQKAVDSLRCMYLPAGTYRISEVYLNSPTSIKAIGERRVAVQAEAGVEHLFNIQSNDVSFEGLNCSMKNAPEAICFYFNTAEKDISGVNILACEVSEAITGLTDANASHTASNVTLDSVDFTNARGTSIHMRDFSGNINLIRVAIHRRQFNNPVYNMGVPGAIFENADGMFLKHFDVNGEANVVNGPQKDWIEQNIGGHGCVFRNCSNVKMVRALMEYFAGSGFVIENCTKFEWENVFCYTFHGYGFDINGLTDSKFIMMKSMVNGGDTDRSEENIRWRNCSDIYVSSMITNVSRSKAVTFENCSDMQMDSVACFEKFNKNSIGVYDAGGNSNIVIESLTDSGTQTDSGTIADYAFVSTGNGITVKKLLAR